MAEWKNVRIGEYLIESKRVSSNPKPQKRITVRLNVKGVEVRSQGNEKAGATKYYSRAAGQFIYGRQNLHKGAFGVIPKELDGYESSADLPCFDVMEGLLVDWLVSWLKEGNHYQTLSRLAHGVGSKRISPDDFLDLLIPLPSVPEQKTLLNRIDSFSSACVNYRNEIDTQFSLLKLLRQQVLQEAIEGKLTAKWRKEHPDLVSGKNHASKMLERIRTEKESLIREGKIRKSKPSLPITDVEKSFNLPNGWDWCRLGVLCRGIFTGPFGSMLHKSDYVPNTIPIVNPTHIVNGQIISDGRICVSQKTKERLKRYSLICGDMVIARRGDLSKCAVIQSQQNGWLCGTGSFFIRGIDINQDFLSLVYTSQKSQAYLLQDSIGQTMDNLNQKLLRKLPISLPPLAEQQAIVERVDKLMSMIDEMDKYVTERKAQSEVLMQTVLREAFIRE